jgi:S1-C subfamily serine protease
MRATSLWRGTLVITAGIFLASNFADIVIAADGDAVKSSTNTVASSSSATDAKGSGFENSVVKIFATMRYPDHFRPWTKNAPVDVVGSGVVIEGKRILSNAHLALYASQVQVQANQAGNKISATVEYVSPGMDLAILKLEDESFFDTHPAMPRASVLPGIKDAVMAYGFPEGGSSLSITKGIVSRIEFASYNYPAQGLRIQIDAAINPGNSGGPVMSGDKMIGLAFSRLHADNIGYIIPNEEIDLFLHDIADGRYDGKPMLSLVIQTLENPILHSYLKLNSSVEGVIVRDTVGDTNSPLKQWDVITKIGDITIDNEGMIRQGNNLRLHFSYMIQKIATNGVVPLTVVRAGKELQIKAPVSLTVPRILLSLNGSYPSYFVYGPVVFSTASRELMGAILRYDSLNLSQMGLLDGNPMVQRLNDRPAFDGEELVIVSSPYFPHKLVKGYSSATLQVVGTINNIKIKNLKHLVEVLRDCKDDYVVIEFAGRPAETIVFSRAAMVGATEDILTDNGVRSQGTPDTMAVWNAKPTK